MGLVLDILISGLVVYYVTYGLERQFDDDDGEIDGEELIPIPDWQGYLQVAFQMLVDTMVWIFCVVRA